jgi:hypothetical protein
MASGNRRISAQAPRQLSLRERLHVVSNANKAVTKAWGTPIGRDSASLSAKNASSRNAALSTEGEPLELGHVSLQEMGVANIDTCPRADCVVGFSFGTAGTNAGLAFAVDQWAKKQERTVPLFLQWEIADELPDTSALQETGNLVVARPEPGKYLSTVGVAEQFASVWRASGVRTVAVAAQHDHLERCCRCVRDLGFNTVLVPIEVSWSQFKCDEYGYDRRSKQPWTRVRWRFLVWNKIAGCLGCCAPSPKRGGLKRADERQLDAAREAVARV